MTDIIIDTSVVIKWFSAAKEENITQADKIQEEITTGNINAICPQIIFLELVNALKFGKDFDKKDCLQAITDFRDLPLKFIETPETSELITIMYKHELTSYDAAFVALAISKNIPLITADYKHHRKEISKNILWLSEWEKSYAES